jgi:amino acid transporter
MQVNTKGKVLSVFTLMMINVIAVDSLRTLPISAEYGSSLIFYYVVAAVCFFIPTALVTAELATGWPNTGGAYVWVTKAFGPKIGFTTLCGTQQYWLF